MTDKQLDEHVWKERENGYFIVSFMFFLSLLLLLPHIYFNAWGDIGPDSLTCLFLVITIAGIACFAYPFCTTKTYKIVGSKYEFSGEYGLDEGSEVKFKGSWVKIEKNGKK